MRFRIALLSTFLLILFGCKEPEPEIEVACELDNLSNYILKWNLYPLPEKGSVAIYASSDPDSFNTELPPLRRVEITDGFTKIIPSCGLKRLYFLLRFNDQFNYVVGTRAQQLENVQNFRDIGGYRTNDHRSIRWGRLYRSGSLDRMDSLSVKRLQCFNIKSLIDFRINKTPFSLPDSLSLEKIVNLPIQITPLLEIQHKIEAQEARRGDVVLCMEDLYLSLIEKEKSAFRAFFKLLADKESYPVILTDYYGKDIVGFGTALVLYLLEIPEEVILDDYMLSNLYFDKRAVAQDAIHYTLDTQEAITTLLNADPRYLTVAIKRIKRQYGSVENYLEKELDVTPSRKRHIQQNLLTNN